MSGKKTAARRQAGKPAPKVHDLSPEIRLRPVCEAMRILKIGSRQSYYRLLQSGALRTKIVGGKRMTTERWIEEYLNEEFLK